MDFASYTGSALQALLGETYAEVQRRAALAQAASKIRQVQADYLTARDPATIPTEQRTKVAEWPAFKQPVGAHDAYPYGWVISESGKLYKANRADKAPSSQVPSTVPTEWVDVTYDLLPALKPPADTIAAWSATATYKVGGKVTRNGRIWQCLLAHGAEQQGNWAPSAYTPTIWADKGPTT